MRPGATLCASEAPLWPNKLPRRADNGSGGGGVRRVSLARATPLTNPLPPLIITGRAVSRHHSSTCGLAVTTPRRATCKTRSAGATRSASASRLRRQGDVYRLSEYKQLKVVALVRDEASVAFELAVAVEEGVVEAAFLLASGGQVVVVPLMVTPNASYAQTVARSTVITTALKVGAWSPWALSAADLLASAYLLGCALASSQRLLWHGRTSADSISRRPRRRPAVGRARGPVGARSGLQRGRPTRRERVRPDPEAHSREAGARRPRWHTPAWPPSRRPQ